MTIKSRIRTIPNFPKEGIMFRDISTLLSDPEGLQIVVKSLQERYQNRNDIDLVVGVEARGFIFGSLLAYALNKGFIMIRKPGKLPGHTISQEYQLEYGVMLHPGNLWLLHQQFFSIILKFQEHSIYLLT